MKKIDWKQCLPYVAAVVLFLGFALLYCSPLFEGKVLQAGDVTHWEGFSHDIDIEIILHHVKCMNILSVVW